MKRIIAVVLVGMFLASAVLVQPVRAEGLLSDFFDTIKRWFESSPFGNLFSTPIKRMETLTLSFYPEDFEFDITEPVNMSTENTEISNFKGTINIDMNNKLMLLSETDTSLKIKENIGTIGIHGLKINSLELKDLKLVIRSGNWNETTENGTVTIKDFLGTCLVRDGVIELEGNVSKVIKA